MLDCRAAGVVHGMHWQQFFIQGIAAGALALAMPAPAEDEEAFTPLFNGRDLTGWVNVNGAPETWSVRDGMIYCEGTPICALRTEKQYENFVLEAEWRHLTPGGNAGIFIWAGPLPAPGTPFLRAIEVQVLDHAYGTADWFTTHGDVFAIHGSTMRPFPPSRGMRSFPVEHRSKGSPEWNHYRITCQDGVIRLAVNGKDVSGGSDCVWRKGYIGLESEGAPVEWRNIRIRELPGGTASAEQTAPEAPKNAACLYDGRTLRGWKTAEPDAWKHGNWELECSRAGSPLTLAEPLGEGTLILDIGSGDDAGNSSVAINLGSARLSGGFPKGWHRLTIVRDGTKVSASRGDEPFASASVGEGPLTLTLDPPANARLANIFWIPAEPSLPAGGG